MPATRPSYFTTITASTPLVYEVDPGPVGLSADEVRAVLAYADEIEPSHRPIWYLHVRYLRDAQKPTDSRYWTATLYFTPGTTSPRVRSGRCLDVGIQTSGNRPADRERYRMSDRAPRRYLQISLRHRPFGDERDLPEPWTAAIPQPEGITDSDVIELVDLVRFAMAHPSQDRRDPTSMLTPGLAIQSIRKSRDSVEVMTIGEFYPWGGSGDVIYCRKRHGKWVIDKVGMWIS